MIVCVCHRITESDIAAHAREGCGSFEELQEDLLVATACGACRDCARVTFDNARCGCASCSDSRVHGTTHRHTLALI
jgi:bacterioferritin-associated ferredoxin